MHIHAILLFIKVVLYKREEKEKKRVKKRQQVGNASNVEVFFWLNVFYYYCRSFLFLPVDLQSVGRWAA